jgi:hypothetical protein
MENGGQGRRGPMWGPARFLLSSLGFVYVRLKGKAKVVRMRKLSPWVRMVYPYESGNYCNIIFQRAVLAYHLALLNHPPPTHLSTHLLGEMIQFLDTESYTYMLHEIVSSSGDISSFIPALRNLRRYDHMDITVSIRSLWWSISTT